LIVVESPKPGDVVSSPLIISGKARGTWFFESTFPVKLLDAKGTVLAFGPASAQEDWMTAEFVPFKITLTFPAPSTDTGTIELHNDNPSGMPERDDLLVVPVVFKAGAKVDAGCKPSGCYGEDCVEKTEAGKKATCSKYTPTVTCYMDTLCERQSDGKCGWTETSTLSACLKSAAK
jgi:hypothetical protein